MDLTELRKGGRELRIDVGSLRSRGRRTPQGFLRVPGNLTRTGVLTYYRSDGSKFRELRHPAEVFNEDSLGSLAFAPVTERHPAGLVSPKNVSSVQVGVVTGARKDGRFVSGELVVQSDQTIAGVLGGKLRELSPGYTCRIDHTAGEWDGERYDGIQRGIVYNHLAIGPREWGRSGPDVALKLDEKDRDGCEDVIAFERYDSSAGAGRFVAQQIDLRSMSVRDLAEAAGLEEFRAATIVDGFDFPTDTEARAISSALGLDPALLLDQIPDGERRDTRGARKMETRTIRVDGAEVKVDTATAGFVEKALADRDAKIVDLSKRADEQAGQLDAATTELAEAKTRLDAADDPKKLSEAVAARVDLEKRARKVLGPELKLDGKGDREVKVAVLMKTDDKFDPEGKSDDYVNGRFDHVIASAPDRNFSKERTRTAIAKGRMPVAEPRADADEDGEERIDSAEAAKAKSRRDAAALGTKKLRVSIG